MSESPPTASALDASLRRAHRSVLAALALCAVVIAVQQGAENEPPPDREVTLAVLALAVGIVITRRLGTSPVIQARTRVFLTLASYLGAVGIGVAGVLIATGPGARQTGLVFTAAALIICLRPPPRIATPPPGQTG
jgi:peptidoglycan/LPS O-acetylase OafA/YrhL